MSLVPQPYPIRITFDSPSLERLLTDHLADVRLGGMFIPSETPAKVGALLSFEFLLRGAPCFGGEGTVVWTREPDKSAGSPPGMGVRFQRLSPDAQRLLHHILAERQPRTSPSEGDASGVPEFLDDSGRPTVRVAADRVSRLVAATVEAGQDTKSTMKLAPERVAALVAASRAAVAKRDPTGSAKRASSGPLPEVAVDGVQRSGAPFIDERRSSSLRAVDERSDPLRAVDGLRSASLRVILNALAPTVPPGPVVTNGRLFGWVLFLLLSVLVLVLSLR